MAEHNEKRDNFLDGLQKGIDKKGLKRVRINYMDVCGKVTSERRILSREEKKKAFEAMVSIHNAIKLKQKAGPDGEFNRV